MILNELFNTQVKGEVSKNDDDGLVVSAMIKGRKITFSATPRAMKYPPNAGFLKSRNVEVWGVKFVEKDAQGNQKMSLTSSGGSVEVFSFVIDCMKLLVKKQMPKLLYFATDKSEQSRRRFYERLFAKFGQGYKLVKVADGHEHSFHGYFMERK